METISNLGYYNPEKVAKMIIVARVPSFVSLEGLRPGLGFKMIYGFEGTSGVYASTPIGFTTTKRPVWPESEADTIRGLNNYLYYFGGFLTIFIV